MASKIFISYRRSDSAAAAGRLYDFLENKFGSSVLFRDVDTIGYGRDFKEEIRLAIDDSKIVLVIIGRHFITNEQRLFNPDDTVRYEISYALEKNKLVIPVIVNDAIMPGSNKLPENIQKLATINGPELRNTKWRRDCEEFYEQLNKLYNTSALTSEKDNVLLELSKAEKLFDAENYKEAFKLHFKHRHSEYFTANHQISLSYMYDKGEGIEANDHEALKWMKKSADQGNAEANVYLANAYAEGEGIEQDFEKAYECLLIAANKNNKVAQNNIGFMYENGLWVSQNFKEAFKWYSISAKQNYSTAYNNLGHLYLAGKGAIQSNSRAKEMYKKAINLGDLDGLIFLGYIYEDEKDYQTALKWFGKAADKNESYAMVAIGDLYKNEETPFHNYKIASEWYLKAANLGNERGQNEIAYLYFEGLGVELNVTKAAYWCTLSANQGDMSAQNNMGYMYEKGEGQKKNLAKAISWYQKAAEQGYEPALENLKRLNVN